MECTDFRICWEWEIWGNAQWSLSNEGFVASHYLTQDGLGRIIASFPSILYFVADMLFKTNGRIRFFERKKIMKLYIHKMAKHYAKCRSHNLKTHITFLKTQFILDIIPYKLWQDVWHQLCELKPLLSLSTCHNTSFHSLSFLKECPKRSLEITFSCHDKK